MGDRGFCHAVLSALALLALSLTTVDARAAVDDIPPECGSRESFDEELRKRLGEGAPVESVHVAISRGPDRFHLRVEIGAELRELDDESCSELFRAAIVVAVAMLLHDRTPPEAAPAPAPAEPAPSAQPSARPRFTLSLGGGVNVGTLPHPTPTFELESQALWRYWGAALGVRYLLPSEKLDAEQRGASLQAFGAHAAGIFRPSHAWQARVGFAVQRVTGEGKGSLKTQTASVWAAGPTLGLGLVPYEQGPLWLGLGAEGQLNALRGDFQILNYNQRDNHIVHEVPWLSGSAFVRLGLAW
jgi:hypothetical protein